MPHGLTKRGHGAPMGFKTRYVHHHPETFHAALARSGATIQQCKTTRLCPYPRFIPSAIPQRINL
ncbi:hypothetical protein [Corallococcus macrosporus]|uniref:hypothetical protein n=1 Tax=Corallococcus macrosporus TaxID=35 RepID=UPI0005B948A4|nr:hypothetical protein [Corallococcus macrosporus]